MPIPASPSGGGFDWNSITGNSRLMQFGGDALADLGYGLANGMGASDVFAQASNRTTQMQPARQQYAQQQQEEAKRAETLNQTVEYMRSKGYDDLVAGVESRGMDMGSAWTEALRRGQGATATADWAKLNDGTLFNQRTGETMPLGEGGEIPVDPTESFNREKDLAAQYNAQDPIKTYQAVRNSYERVRSSAEMGNSNTDGSGAADISLVFAYMKMLDPTSVVREGEVASAQNAGGIPANVMGMYNNLLNGNKLTPPVRAQFVQSADAIYQDTSENLRAANGQFTTRAQGWNVNPGNFIQEPESYPAFGNGAPITMPNGNTIQMVP